MTAGARALPAGAAAEPRALGVYVHWPFCRSKCPYCDFNSHVRESVDQRRWCAALLAELDYFAAFAPGRRVTSVYFGGGTPSLMAPVTVGRVIERIAARWTLEESAEITLEANPTSVEAGAFAGFAAAGVNRVSLGVQALDDRALRFLGRNHDAAEALAALALARRHFPRFSFDLIYARPGQTPRQWRAELERALDEAPAHLSVYQLTIEPGTAFATRARLGELDLPAEARAAALYELTQELLERAGLPAYEISSHARAGEESRHNLQYWRYGDYLGIGPGAHGRLTLDGAKQALRQRRLPERWLDAVESVGQATEAVEPISAGERRDEMTMMGLRLIRGISRPDFRRELGAEPEALYDRSRLAQLTAAGFLELNAEGLKATPAGLRRLDAVLGALLA